MERGYMKFTDGQITKLINAIVLNDLWKDDPDDPEALGNRDALIHALNALGYDVQIDRNANGDIKKIDIIWNGFTECDICWNGSQNIMEMQKNV